jgi:hypothetical protein
VGVSLAISKDLGGVRRCPGSVFLASHASFAREPAKAFLSPRRSLCPAIIAVFLTHPCATVPFRAIVPLAAPEPAGSLHGYRPTERLVVARKCQIDNGLSTNDI